MLASYIVQCEYHLSLTSWHILLECSRVHSRTPVFLRGCLVTCVGRTDVQWSQVRLSGSETHQITTLVKFVLLSPKGGDALQLGR